MLRGNREEMRIMGRVLSFVPRTAATKRPPRNNGSAAAVIIFPGVRYERQRGPDGREIGATEKARPSQPTPVPHH